MLQMHPLHGMVQYGMVWYGTVRYGMVWYGMVRYGMVWCGMVWYRTVRYGMVWHGMVRYGMVWYGAVWYGMVWYGMVWYGMVWYDAQDGQLLPTDMAAHRLTWLSGETGLHVTVCRAHCLCMASQVGMYVCLVADMP